MNPEYETGRYLYKKWKLLPEITGNFDCLNRTVNEETKATTDNFPEFDKSVSVAVKENILTLEDIAEVVLQVYERTQTVLLGVDQFFKNDQNQFLQIHFESQSDFEGEKGLDSGHLTELNYQMSRPIVFFYPDIKSAQEGSTHAVIESEYLPRHYFL